MSIHKRPEMLFKHCDGADGGGSELTMVNLSRYHAKSIIRLKEGGKGMDIVNLKCPNCGGSIRLYEARMLLD